MWLYHFLHIYSSVDEYLGYLHILTIIKKDPMNIYIDVFVWTNLHLIGLNLVEDLLVHMTALCLTV